MTVKLDPILAEILACPCPVHAPVQPGTVDDSDADVIQCRRCLTTFPVTDEIPVMLLDEATPGPQGIGADLTGTGPAEPPSR